MATLPTVDALRIHRRLTAIAQGLDDPTRTRDQKRADTLVDLLLAAPGGPAAASAAPAAAGPAHGGGGAAEVCVVVSLDTLLRLDDRPAELVGAGPIGADAARLLAADAPWRAWVTDAAGSLAGVGTRRYTPTAALARLVRGREPRCRMPGCQRAAQSCDVDHTIPWPAGPTGPANLGVLCRRHHNHKTRRRWRLANSPTPEIATPDPARQPPPHGYTWTTPAGIDIHDTIPPPLE